MGGSVGSPVESYQRSYCDAGDTKQSSCACFCLAHVRRSRSVVGCSQEVCRGVRGSRQENSVDSIKTSESGGRAHPGRGDTHSLQIAAVEVFRAEGKQHKDDELHHFYDLMHTINEQQTQRTLDQIQSPLQELPFFHRYRNVSSEKVVATPQCGDKSAFFTRGLGRLVRIGPNRHLLNYQEWLRRLDCPSTCGKNKTPQTTFRLRFPRGRPDVLDDSVEVRPRGPDQGPT